MGTLRGSGRNLQSSANIPIWVINNVTGSRAIDGTTYTNNTGKTMFVSITVNHHIQTAPASTYITLAVNGVDISRSAIAYSSAGGILDTVDCLTTQVPPGGTYSVSQAQIGAGSATVLSYWSEAY